MVHRGFRTVDAGLEYAKPVEDTPVQAAQGGVRRSVDRYGGYAELGRYEKDGVDFCVTLRSGNSGIAVVAPHGGGIEPGTTEIAEAIAGGEHTFYGFEGLKVSGNRNLHLTSTKFDEPIGLDAIKRARVVLAIHGCEEHRAIIYMGGLDREMRKKVSKALVEAGFTVGEQPDLAGSDPKNLCNRGIRGGGVQLEISSGLRRLMFEGLSRQGRKKVTLVFHEFVTAVRQAITDA